MKAYAENGGGGNVLGGKGALVSSPTRPTSVQGQFYAKGGRSSLPNSPRGRGVGINFVPPRRTRTR